MELALVGRLLAACAVIGLVLVGVQFVALRLAGGRVGRGGGRLISLVETTNLPGAASLHVVRIAERYYVVGRNAAALGTLCEISAESVERWLAAPTSASPNPLAPVVRFVSRFGRQT